MKIEFNLFASLDLYMPDQSSGSSSIIEIESASTVQEILEKHSVPLEQVKLIFINGIRGTLDQQLQADDRLGVFPAVAGG